MSGPDIPKSIQVLRDQRESYNAALAKENTNEIKLERMQEQLDKLIELKKDEEKKMKQLDLAKKISKQFADDVTLMNRRLEEKQILIKNYVEDIKKADMSTGFILLGQMRAEEEEMKNLAKKRDDTNAQARRNFDSQMKKQKAAERANREWEEAGSKDPLD